MQNQAYNAMDIQYTIRAADKDMSFPPVCCPAGIREHSSKLLYMFMEISNMLPDLQPAFSAVKQYTAAPGLSEKGAVYV